MLVKCIEQYTYVKTYGALQMKKSGATENDINAYKIVIENDVEHFKKHSIKLINKQIPEYLKVLEHFENWDEAMMFLIKFKQDIPKGLLHDKKN